MTIVGTGTGTEAGGAERGAPAPGAAHTHGTTQARTPGRPRPAAQDDRPERRWTSGHAARLGLVVGLGAVLRIGFAATDDSLTADSTAYLTTGRNLLAGNGFTRNGSPELHFPPVTALYLGSLWRIIGDPRTAVAVSTVIAGTAVLLPLAAIARRLGGDRAALVAAAIGATAPGLVAQPALAGGGSEGPYLFFVLLAVWALGRWNDSRAVDPARSIRWAAGTGLAVGLAYLTRPEAMFVAAGLGSVILVVSARNHRRSTTEPTRPLLAWAQAPAAFSLALAVAAAPYVVYLHAETGSWSPTAKSQDASMVAWRAVAEGDREIRDRELYGLDDTGVAFSGDRTSLLALVRRDPSGFGDIVRINSGNVVGAFTEAPTVRNVWHWTLVPIPVTLLAVLGAWRRRRDPGAAALLGAGAAAIATGLMFFVQPRYLLTAVAACAVFAGSAIVGIERRAWRWGAMVIVGGLLVAPYVSDVGVPNEYWDTREQAEHATAGEWLAANTEPDARIMTRSMVVAFSADREAVAMPYSTIDELRAFARQYGVTYIVLDQFNLRSLRPQFKPLFSNDRDVLDGFTVAHQFRYRGRVTRILTLDPPPTERAPNPPGLGFVGDS